MNLSQLNRIEELKRVIVDLEKRIEELEASVKDLKAKLSHAKYKFKRPWCVHLQAIKARCNYKSTESFKRYGGKGIKCLITESEIKSLWLRDKAYLMEKPTIDRINASGHYEVSNCRFVERVSNVRFSSATKLNEKQVIEIREKLERGAKGRDLAKEYGVTEYNISAIKHGEILILKWEPLPSAPSQPEGRS